MPLTTNIKYAFNRGELGKSSLSRIDRDAFSLAGEEQINWMPLAQGPMMLRPGSAYLGNTASNAAARLVPFVFTATDTALLELTNNSMRVWVNDALVTRPSVATAVSNGTFSSSTGWSLTASSGATSVISGNKLTLTAAARGSNAAATQTIAVAGADQNKEHALRIVVDYGPVYFKVGSAAGKDDLVARTALGKGTHSISFTPATTFTFEFDGLDRAPRVVSSCNIEAAGVVSLPTLWPTASLGKVQYVQSGDIIYVACAGIRPQKIERRATRSWSVVEYQQTGGPFRLPDGSESNIQLSCDAYEGIGNLTATDTLFTSGHVGTLFRLFPTGQVNQTTLAGNDTWSEPIRVNGIGATERGFSIIISGTWVGSIYLQGSVEGPTAGFTDTDYISAFTGNTAGTTMADNPDFNNVVVWYRLGFRPGTYTSGAATVSFGPYNAFHNGPPGSHGKAFVVRVISVTDATHAVVEVLTPADSLNATKDWLISEWSGIDGWPTAVTLFDGRLWWGGQDHVWGSISDDYENFDYDFAGDAGSISRSLGSGPVDTISWLLPLSRLQVGRATAVSSIRSDNFDAPLTPTNFTIKNATTRGCSTAMPAVHDSRGIYVHANGRQVFELEYQVTAQDYVGVDLTQFNLDIGLPVFSRLAAAHSPDNRVFFVRNDGVMAVLLRDMDGETALASWWRMTRTGNYEDVAVLPNAIEDKVYVIVNYNGSRFIEVFARRDECLGAPLTKCLDSHIVYSGAGTTTLTGLSHLNGATVAVWGAASGDTTGSDLGTYTVTSGQITGLPISVVKAVVGLPYTASYMSGRLDGASSAARFSSGAGFAIGTIKRLDQIGFVLFDTHAQGLLFGPDFDHLDPLPQLEDENQVATDFIWSQYDKKVHALPARWDPDARLCLQGASPRPVTVGAVILLMEASV